MNYLTRVIDAGGKVNVACFDFRKTFNTFDNDILLNRFSAIGYTTHLIYKNKNALPILHTLRNVGSTSNTQDGYLDLRPHLTTLSGISQGSNLGPLEFIIVANDLPEVVIKARCLLFANDMVANTSDCS